MARRETRSEAEAFLARLEGRSVGERQRLTAEHRSYLAGERATDAEFGADEPRASTRSGPAGVARAAPSARRPPMGKTAAYLAALQKRKEEVEAEEPSEQSQDGKGGRAKGKRPASTKRKKAAGPKKLTAREEKAAQEAVAISRAAAQASKKSLERKKERLRLEKEEKRGADARAAALARLEKKKETAVTDKATKKGKKSKKTAASSTAKAKKRKTSPHEAAVDADDESEVSSPRMPSKSDEEVPSVPAQAPVGPVPSPQTRTTSSFPKTREPSIPGFPESVHIKRHNLLPPVTSPLMPPGDELPPYPGHSKDSKAPEREPPTLSRQQQAEAKRVSIRVESRQAREEEAPNGERWEAKMLKEVQRARTVSVTSEALTQVLEGLGVELDKDASRSTDTKPTENAGEDTSEAPEDADAKTKKMRAKSSAPRVAAPDRAPGGSALAEVMHQFDEEDELASLDDTDDLDYVDDGVADEDEMDEIVDGNEAKDDSSRANEGKESEGFWFGKEKQARASYAHWWESTSCVVG
uniref:Uncharacterized protein n=1 Tax=Phytophthora ramorum TaxID=164328 RepID=H3GTL2_PHYRM